jgi:hypothetical protein
VLVSLPGVLAKILVEFSEHAIEFFRIGARLTLDRDVWPDRRVVGIQLEPVLKAGLGVGDDGLGRAFRLANPAVDALIGMDASMFSPS